MSEQIDPTTEEMPQIIKDFIAQADPPEGYGNDRFEPSWRDLFVFFPFLLFWLGLIHSRGIAISLLIAAICLIVLYGRMVQAFKDEMVFVSNPFDFVKAEMQLLLCIVILFGFAFFYTNVVFHHQFNSAISLFDAIYFSFITIGTVGYGDIYPIGIYARFLVVLEMCSGVWFFVTIIPVALSDQTERLKNFRVRRQKLAQSVKAGFEAGELKPNSFKPNMKGKK
ncbi:MAG: potassium channel family protein [Janthinobacterium lividum]